MKLKRAIVLLLTLCMIFSMMSPAASALHRGVISGADSKGNASVGQTGSNNVGQIGSNGTNGSLSLRDQLLQNQLETGSDGSLTKAALGQLKNETLAELKAAAEAFGPGEVVSAFVVMDTKPTSAMYMDINSVPASTTEALLKKQTSVLENIRQRLTVNSTLTVRYQFTYLMNAFSITTEFKNLAEIAEIPGVASVFIMPQFQPLAVDTSVGMKTASSAGMVGASSVWQDVGLTGKGMRIAIVDTGLDLDHPAFAAIPELTDASLTVEEIARVLPNLYAYKMMAYQDIEITAEDLYRSGKVPFGFNYSDWNLSADHSKDSQGDHGTHVAGIAAANKVEGVEYCGMAPDAQIIVMKVFGNAGSMMDGVIAALEDALVLNCDVVNMSLGASAGFTSISSAIDEVFARIQKQDMIVAVAAGNEYTSGLMNAWGDHTNQTAHPDNATVASPATYINTTVVGSVNNAVVLSKYFSFDGNMVGYRDTDGIPTFATLAGKELEYVIIPGLGEPADFEGIDVVGKVALVTRGNITFMEKMQNAARAGAVGVLIVNNAPGSVSNFGMDFTGVSAPIVPCVMISMEDGAKMAASETKIMTVSREEGLVPAADAGQMSDFSSWGVAPELRLLPNLSGVGGNVMSTIDNGQYGLMSGTSMATPQVAGVSALVLQYLKATFPEKTDAERRVMADALLMSTAVPVISATSGVEASPRQQGAGLVNALGAVTSGAYLSVPGDSFGSTKPAVNLYDDPDKFGEFKFTFSIHNVSDVEKTYTLEGSLLTEDAYVLNGKTLMDGNDRELSGSLEFSENRVTVPANTSVKVTVSIKLSEEDKQWLDTVYPNGGYVEGFIYCVAEEGGVDLSLPYMGFYGDWNQAPVFDTGFWYDNAFWYEDVMPNRNQLEHIIWTKLGDQNWLLGINPYTNLYVEEMYNPTNNVVSPNGDGHLDGLDDIYLSQMRNARSVTYTFTDENGTVLYQVTDSFCKKTLYYITYGQMIPTLFSWSGYEMYDFTDASGNLLPNGTKVTLTIEALTDYKNGGKDVNVGNTLTFDIYVDCAAPKLENLEQIVEGDRNFVKLTVTDDTSLAYVALANASGTRYLDAQTDCIDFTRNDDGTWTVLMEVTGFGSKLQVILCDYGANEASYPIEFNAADNLPVLEQGTLYGYRVFDLNYALNGQLDYMYGWQSINKETGELTEQTNDYQEYYALTAAEYVDGIVFAVDAGHNLLWMEPGLWDRHNIVNLGTSVLDMTFDETTNTMFLLAKESDGGADYTVLYTMDLLTGALEPLNHYQLGSYGSKAPWCLADVNGELYVGLYNSRSVGKLNKDLEIEILLDYKEDEISLPTATNYAQSMTYDAQTNSIYWAFYGSGNYSALLKIDLTYDEVNDFILTESYVEGEPEMVGLFVLADTDYELPDSEEPKQLVLNQDRVQLLIGESEALSASPLPWNAPMGELSWSSSDEKVATVDENGVVTAIGEGYADITVTDGTLEAVCEVRVIEIYGSVNGFNFYALSEEGQATYNVWFELDLSTMEISAISDFSDVSFMVADYNGHNGMIYGYDEYGQFYSYNPATGEVKALGNGIAADKVPLDMAYDYNTGLMYGITQNSNYGTGSLSTIDMTTGAITEVQFTVAAMQYDSDEDVYYGDYSMDVYMTLAWTPEGMMAITMDGRLVKLVPTYYTDFMTNETRLGLGSVEVMDGLGTLQYTQSMCYDHATGKLVWGSVENYSIVWIDPVDPAAVYLGLPQDLSLFQFVGLYSVPKEVPELPAVDVQAVVAENMTLLTGAVKSGNITVYPSNATNVEFSFSSDNEKVATIDELGNITAVSVGTANISVIVKGDGDPVETSFVVTVKQGGATIYGHLAGDAVDGSSQYWISFEDYNPSGDGMRGEAYSELYIYAAEYCAETDRIYAYGYNQDAWDEPWYFLTLTPDWQIVNRVDVGMNFPFVYDMTYNYVEGTMYAVASVGTDSSDLYKVNMETGELLFVMDLLDAFGGQMMATSLAANAEGELFAMSTSIEMMDWETWQQIVTGGLLYWLDVENEYAELVGDTGFKHNKLGSMAFDMDTGNLYWASYYQLDYYSPVESFIVLVDTETGAGTSLGVASRAGVAITGMYIPAEKENYPESQAVLSVEIGKDVVSGYVGQTIRPSFLITGGEGATVQWASADESVATVDEKGMITAVAPGATYVTVTVTRGEEAVSASIAVAVIANDSYILAFNNQTNTWEKISRKNPAFTTVIEGSETEATLMVAEAVDGVIYAYDVEGNFYTISTTDFTSKLVGTLDLSGIAAIRDLAYDHANNRLLALVTENDGRGAVYQVDLATGAILLLTSIWDETDGENVCALTVGLDGTVYILDSNYNGDNICILDIENGGTTFVNSLFRISVYADTYEQQIMTTDPLTGIVYVMTTSNGRFYNLSTFNPADSLLVDYGPVGETWDMPSDFGFNVKVGNTYSAMVFGESHIHAFAGEAEIVEDSCSHYEATKQNCLLCGDVLTVVTDHDYQLVKTVAPDCVNPGYDRYVCSDENCGASYMGNIVPATGHTPEAGKEATCTEALYCTVCQGVVTPALGHQLGEVCSYGNNTGTCVRCGEENVTVYVPYGSAQIVGHDYQVEGVVCESGYQNATCTRCGKTGYTYVTGVGHARPEGEVLDCTEDYECANCGKYIAGHKQHHYDREIVDATCAEAGSRTYSCVRCSTVKAYELEKPAHTPGAEATCTEAQICTVCGEVLMPALGHTPGAAATCTTAQTCSACGVELAPALGHTPVVAPGYDATCTESGKTNGQICLVCGAWLVYQQDIAPLGHTWLDATYEAPKTCAVCGVTEGMALERPPVEVDTGDVVITAPEGVDADKAQEIVDSLTEAAGAVKQPETGIDGNTAVIESAKENIKDENGEKIVGNSYETSLNITMGKVEIAAEGENTVVVRIVYEVTPYLYALSEDGSVLGETKLNNFETEVTFRLPLDKNLNVETVKVLHEGELLGYFEVQTDENGNKFVEVKSKNFSEFTVEAHNHEYTAEVTAPTCTTAGFTTYTCACGDTYTADEVSALGHTEVVDAAVAATCTETGLTEGKHCSVCGEVLAPQTEVPATGHSFGEWVVTKEATEQAEGEETRTCACGETETRSIPKLEPAPTEPTEPKPTEPKPTEPQQPGEESGSNTVVIVIVVVVVLGVAAAAVVLFLKKRK